VITLFIIYKQNRVRYITIVNFAKWIKRFWKCFRFVWDNWSTL